jgi:hypothetical protein
MKTSVASQLPFATSGACLIGFALTCFLGHSVCQAQILAGTFVNTSVRGTSNGDQGLHQSSAEQVRSFPSTHGIATGRAQAESRQGRFTATVYAEVAGHETVSMTSRADGGFTDGLTITAPGRIGQPGLLTASMQISGTLTAGSTNPEFPERVDSFAEVRARFSLRSAQQEVFEDMHSVRTKLGFTGDGEHKLITLTVPFIFGDPIEVNFSMELEADCNSGNVGFAAIAIARFGNSASWTGIGSVTDGEGVPVEDFTVTSISGADFTRDFSTPPGPVLTLVPESGLHWQSVVGETYQLMTSLNLTGWEPVGEPLPGTGEVMEVPVDFVGSQQLFLLEVLETPPQ